MYMPKVCLTAILVIGVAQAQEHPKIDVYRDQDGQLTAEAVDNLELLKAEANLQGYVTLWLTANVPYNPETDAMSPRQIAKQNQSVRQELHKVLQPLVAAGLVWYVPERPRVEGPGRLVRANVVGLMRLVEDHRLLNIGSGQ